MLILSRAVVTMVNDAKGLQTVQVTLFDGEVDELPRHQEYGFTSRPPVGSEAVAAFVGGNRDNGIVISCEHREYRIKLPNEADVALYDRNGNKVHLSPTDNKIIVEARNDIEINATSETGGNVTINAGGAAGNVKINATGAASSVEINANGAGGKVIVNATNIFLGNEPLANAGGGVVTTMCACITGGMHAMGSQTVKAKIA